MLHINDVDVFDSNSNVALVREPNLICYFTLIVVSSDNDFQGVQSSFSINLSLSLSLTFSLSLYFVKKTHELYVHNSHYWIFLYLYLLIKKKNFQFTLHCLSIEDWCNLNSFIFILVISITVIYSSKKRFSFFSRML